MENPYNMQASTIRSEVFKILPHGIDSTADLLLEFMSKSDDEHLKEMAAYIKASRKSEEIGLVFNFAMSLLQSRCAYYKIFFKMMQNKMYYAVHKHTVAEQQKETNLFLNEFFYLV